MKKAFPTIAAVFGLAISGPLTDSAKGAALALDGDGDWVSFAGAGIPTGNAPFTLGAWINPTSPTGGGAGGQITFWGEQAGNQSNGFRMRGPAGVRHYFWGNDHDEDFSGGSILPDDSGPNGDGWHHLALTFDGSETRWYHNGAILGAPRAVSDVTVADSNYRIGARLAAEFFDGFIDEVSVWGAALGADDIAGGYNQPINPATPGLIAYWNFEDGLTDLAGGDNNGTFMGDASIDTTRDALTVIPEPSSFGLSLTGITALALVLRRRKREPLLG